MTVYFLDSSAIVKRYVTETGSTWIQNLMDPLVGHTVIVARITWVEVASAFARLQRESKLAPTDVALVWRTFQYDWQIQYQVVELDETLSQNASQLLFRHPLRAYDSLQLASSLKLLPVFAQIPAINYQFLASDTRLLTAAQAEGLITDNPNNYP